MFSNEDTSQFNDPLTVGINLVKIINGNTRIICEICSKLTIMSNNRISIDVVLVSLLLTLNIFDTLLRCFHCQI